MNKELTPNPINQCPAIPLRASCAKAFAYLMLALVTCTVLTASKAKAQQKSYAITVILQEAGSLLKAKKLDESKEKYLLALTKDSLNQHALKNVGYIYSLKRDHKSALPYLLKAEKAGRPDAEIYNLLGISYFAVGDTLKSLSSYRQAVSLATDQTSYLKNYGLALVNAGEFTDALKTLDSLVGLTPRDGEIKYLMGNCYAGLSKPREALNSYREAQLLEYDSGDLRYRMGMVSESVGDYWKAEEHYGIGISKSPENLELRQRLAVLYLSSGVYDQAIRLLKENLSRDPKFVNSRVGLGTCYAFMGFSDSAYAELEIVQKTNNSKYETMKQMVDGAIKYFNDAKNKKPAAVKPVER